jgi:hypothetical protein
MTRAHTDPGSPAEAHQVQEADQPPEVTVILPKGPALLTQPAAKALPAFICDEYLHHHTTDPSADHPRLGEYTVDGRPSGPSQRAANRKGLRSTRQGFVRCPYNRAYTDRFLK